MNPIFPLIVFGLGAVFSFYVAARREEVGCSYVSILTMGVIQSLVATLIVIGTKL